MCTLTIVRSSQPNQAGQDPASPWLVRIVCNRDESRSRPAALPPAVRQIGDTTAVMPIDPQGGGTWIAANDAGLSLVLLNSNPDGAPRPPHAERPSRGQIIMQLIGAASLQQALDNALSIAGAQYEPFRLVLVDDQQVAEVSNATSRVSVSLPPQQLVRPVLFVSSGLGDRLVAAPRRELFEQFVAGAPARRQWQDEFHRVSWPDRRHLSPSMSRPEARTVSCTVVEIRPKEIRMAYHGDAPDRPVPTTEIMLPRSSAEG